jgi:CRISPR/Cas system-associated exonuclease Cas4 (RecB family)
VPDIKNEFAWSWSRHQTFYECPRKLYWQHYGSWGGWRSDATLEAALAYRLKRIQTIAMLVGDTFHEELSEILRRRPAAPGPVPAAQLRQDMERRLLRRMRESHDRDWERFGNPKEYAILFEDYYGGGVTAEMREAALDDVRACAEGLAASPFGRRIFNTDPKRLKFIDPREFGRKRVTVDGLLVFASPDLIVADSDADLHIVDWKTGKRRHKANMAQLAVYGLFVAEQFGTPIERITAHLVYVRAGGHETFDRLSDGVEEARRNIETYVTDVRSRLTDVERNEAGDMSQFPMTTNLASCRSCNFRELCGR